MADQWRQVTNFQMELSLNHNEEAWWLVLFSKGDVLVASPTDLGSLWNSDTDVEFPLFYCSGLHANTSVPFALGIFLLVLWPAPIVTIILMKSMNLFIVFSPSWLHLNSPKTPLKKCHNHSFVCHKPQDYIPLHQLQVWEQSWILQLPDGLLIPFHSQCF